MLELLRSLVQLVARWLRALLEPAADPRRDYAERRQAELLRQLRAALEGVGRAKGHLAATIEEVRGTLPSLEKQARRALAAGQEDAARVALRRRQLAAAELGALETRLRDLELDESRLRLLEARLMARIRELHAREEWLAARQSAVEARAWIDEALGGTAHELADLRRSLEEAEAKSEDARARALAIDELGGTVAGLGEPLAGPLEELELAAAVEAALVGLRRRVAADEAADLGR